MSIKSFLSLPFAKYVVNKNRSWMFDGVKSQNKIFISLISQGKNTVFGKDHLFADINCYSDWKKNVPVRDYEELKKYINRVVDGEKNILWPGRPLYFCKTSGTTSGIKYIPISKSSMPNHIRGARDAILSYIAETKNSSIVRGKMIFLQGSPKLKNTNGVLTGRLSGIVAHHIPLYLTKNRLPSFEVNSIGDWEEKIDAIVDETINENMTVVGGIPPWVQMYFEKLVSKKNNLISSIFPSFSLFIHGGVNYSPYKKSFEKLIGKSIDKIELYPASEGFIAYQNSQKEEGLLLCVNHGIFYEFIAADDFFKNNPDRISLKDVVIGVNYVILMSTNAGLWAYNIGDTIKFVSKNPFKIVVTGRIAHFTSAFGEHVIVQEVENSLKEAIKVIPAEITEFHVAPQVNPKKGLPYHEWFVEFEKIPSDISDFENLIDLNLQKYNSYYKDLIVGKILQPLKITLISKNGFRKYMKSIGKLGGQNKIPRLANDRRIAEKIISL